LGNTGGDVWIYENAPGCNSPEEIDSICLHLIVPELSTGMFCYVYPNPLSTSTVIEYNLKELSMVSLTVFNPFGQQVETLVNDYQQQ